MAALTRRWRYRMPPASHTRQSGQQHGGDPLARQGGEAPRGFARGRFLNG